MANLGMEQKSIVLLAKKLEFGVNLLLVQDGPKNSLLPALREEIVRNPQNAVFDLNPDSISALKLLNQVHQHITASTESFKNLFEPVYAINHHFESLRAEKRAVRSKVFLFVPKIDSPVLDSAEFKTALGLLVATDGVTMAATTAAPYNFLFWDVEMLAQFNWFVYEAKVNEVTEIIESGAENEKTMLQSVGFLVKSLTTRQKAIL